MDTGNTMASGLFSIDREARQYIMKNCRGAVTIVLDFHPMMGGG